MFIAKLSSCACLASCAARILQATEGRCRVGISRIAQLPHIIKRFGRPTSCFALFRKLHWKMWHQLPIQYHSNWQTLTCTARCVFLCQQFCQPQCGFPPDATQAPKSREKALVSLGILTSLGGLVGTHLFGRMIRQSASVGKMAARCSWQLLQCKGTWRQNQEMHAATCRNAFGKAQTIRQVGTQLPLRFESMKARIETAMVWPKPASQR